MMRAERVGDAFAIAALCALAIAIGGLLHSASALAAAGDAPVLTGALSRKVHGVAGTFDLALSLVLSSPTTEPRSGPTHTLVFVFDKPVVDGAVAVTEGAASTGLPSFNGNEMQVLLTGVADGQYVTVAVTSVVAVDGGAGGAGAVRVGFLLGDVSGNRVVTLSDLGQVNAQVAQFVDAGNFLKDVNASGTLSLADKGITNTRITKALATPPSAPEQPPHVNAGADQSVTLAAGANLAASSSDDGLPSVPGVLTLTWSEVSGPGVVNFTNPNAAATSATFSAPGTYVLRLTANDGTLSNADDVTITVTADGTGLPPDPATVASPLDPTVASTLAAATSFLYTGTNRIQTAVGPGAIDAKRVAVLRGRVFDRSNAPLPGVTISVLNHPELGQTMSRGDGTYDLAVNGGGTLTLRYDKGGLLPAQRQVTTPWQDYVIVADVVLVELDSRSTAIAANAPTLQVARGSLVTDSDGPRTATLLFPVGTSATMVLPNGSTQPLATMTVRATEYTLGANGLNAMPAPLPEGTEYTYAVNLTIDEALAAGARQVDFSAPVPFYVDNFLGFAVGTSVPQGSYDAVLGTWVPGPNGRVIKILGSTGGAADIDSIGTGTADQGIALGMTLAERQQLGALYAAGTTLWRVVIAHFTPYDLNWSGGNLPTPNNPPATTKKRSDCDHQKSGSIIGLEAQTCGEAVAIAGTPFHLRYSSDRVPGRKSAFSATVPLSGATVPTDPAGLATLDRIELRADVAGRSITQVFPAAPNQMATFTWDGLDAYGRSVTGQVPATLTTSYVWSREFYSASPGFGAPGTGAPTSVPTRVQRNRTQVQTVTLGAFDARGQGLGGWTLSVHHAYDPTARVLYLGDGSVRSNVVQTANAWPPNGFGTNVRVDSIAVAPDGTAYMEVYSSGNLQVMAVSASGATSVFAGTGACGVTAEAVLATLANLCSAQSIRLGPDGSLYLIDLDPVSNGTRIRRVAGGVITTVAGNGELGFSGDGGPATAAAFSAPIGLAVAPDGTLYIADTFNRRVRRVGVDGIVTTVAGNGTQNFTNPGDGGPATAAPLNQPLTVAVSPAGELYIAGNGLVRRVAANGIISTVAGIGIGCPSSQAPACGDGGPAIQAGVSPRALAFGRDGSLYIADQATHRVRRVTSDGIITSVAGNGVQCISTTSPCSNGLPALQASLQNLVDVAVGPDGSLYVGGERFPVRVSPALPGFADTDIAIASEDGRQLFQFDGAGRHLHTLNTLTGATVYTFAYDVNGRLASVMDGDGDVTIIQRDAAGNPTALVAPFGQITTLSLDGNGFLASIGDPTGGARTFAYTTDGLMTHSSTPRGFLTTFAYDALGQLTREEDAAGGSRSLTRTQSADAATISETSALGVTTLYQEIATTSDDQRHVTTLPEGLQAVTVESPNAVVTNTAPNGEAVTRTLRPDPRFGIAAPLAGSSVSSTPSGLARSIALSRNVTLSNAADPLALATLTDTVSINGLAFVTTYAASNRMFTVTTPLGRQASSSIDAQGRIARYQVDNFEPTTFTHDGHGRITSATVGSGAAARVLSLAYGSDGYLATITDPLSRSTTFTRDAVGRVTGKTDPAGRTVAFAYNADGDLTSIVPPGQAVHMFAYTPSGLLSSYTPPTVGAASSTTFAYNADRQLTTLTRNDGSNVAFSYDAAGRLAAMTTPARTYSYQYSATSGELASIAVPDGSLSYAYDGDLLTGITWTGAVAGSVSRTYDAFFRVASASVNGIGAVQFGYDNDGLLTTAGTLTITRDPQNGLITTAAIGHVAETRSYDGFAQLTDSNTKVDATSIFSVHYSYDALGRITQKTETIGGTASTLAYAYDQAGRLASVTLDNGGSPISSYTYDSNGNRANLVSGSATTAASYDAQDRLIQYGSSTYAFTPNGDLTSRTSAGNTTQYQYDASGNLQRVTLPSGTQIDYVVDGHNRRIGKRVNGALVQAWLYEGITPVAELDSTGQLVSRFVYGTRATVPEYMVRQGSTYRFIVDQLGSPRMIVDVASGSVMQRIDYDEFGRIVNDTNPGFQPFGFAGGLYDGHTGLVRFGARDYDAETGRWTTKDPILFGGGDTNLYSYVRQDPVNFADATGLKLDEKKCNKILEILDYEAKHGTYETAWKFSNTFPGPDAMGKLFDNGATPTPFGDVDLDWYATVVQFDYPPDQPYSNNYDFTYQAGKLAWSGGRAAQSLLQGRPRTFPLPYQDEKEVLALDLLRNGHNHFSDLFPRQWLRTYCDCK